MKTGMQFTIATPASMICSVYHLTAASEPTEGRRRPRPDGLLENPDDSSVRPGDFSTTCAM